MTNPAIPGPSFFIGKGDDSLISFGSGQPDLPPPEEAFKVLSTFRGFKYGLVQGSVALRSELAKQYPDAEPEDFVITNGASEAIDLVLRAISEPGGKVLLPRPYYYSYPHNVTLAGMTPVYYDLDENGKINIEVFKKAAEGVRAVMINSPSNPTGTVQEVETLKEVEQFCARKSIYIISDEVYKDLIYVRENYLLHGPHVVTVNSFSKTYAMCGLRVGYLYSKERELVEKIIEMKTHTAMNTSILAQDMALAALAAPRSYVTTYVDIWKERRDMMYAGMKGLGLDLWEPEGAFYVLPRFTQSGRVVSDLYYTYRMITYDGAWFGAPDRVRFSYALDVSKIEEGLRRLQQFLENEYRTY
ncbi:MAG: pyridoxal phosphate-dependent aminotransferase [Patescibacteria group bacterium]